MPEQRFELIDAFSVRDHDGTAIVYPPGVVRVQSGTRGHSIAVGNHDAVYVPSHEIERLMAKAVALPT